MTLLTGRIPVDANHKPVLAGVSSLDGLAVTTVYVDPSTHALLTSATFTPSGTQDVNVKTINGVTTLMGNGATGTGSQRVTIASDNTPFPVKIDQTTPGTTNLVALAANQSVNTAQINGVTPLMGNGVTGTGSARVTVASDNTPFAVKIDQTTPGTTNLVALAANQSVNVAQINGVTTLMGNGATGTGSQRVTVSSDNSAVSGFGVGATAAAIPANAVMIGLSDGTNLVAATQAKNALNTSAGGLQAVALTAQLDDTAPTTITENQFGNLRMTANRALMVDSVYTVTRVTGDTQIKASAGFVHAVTISPTTATPTAGLITVYDNTAESGTQLFSEWMTATATAHTIILDGTAATGIYVGYDATAASISVSVSWR